MTLFKLEKLNVVRLTDSSKTKEKLEGEGFALVSSSSAGAAEDAPLTDSIKAVETVGRATAAEVDNLTVAELQEYLTAQGKTFKKTASKIELLQLAYTATEA